MKRIFRIIIAATIMLILVSTPVLGAYTYYANILVQETDGNDYDYLPIIADVDNDYLSDNGYISLTGLDTRVLSGSTELPHMLSDDKVLFVPESTDAHSTSNYKYTLGNDGQPDFPIIVGNNGYITTADDANLELASEWEIEQSGYIDVTADTNKDLVIKPDAFRTYIQAAGTIRSTTLAIGAVFPTVDATNGGNEVINTTDHTINLPAGIVVADLLLVFLAMDGDEVITFPAGWTELFNDYDGFGGRFVCSYKVASGTEGATINVTTGNAQMSAHNTYRISGYSGVPEAGVRVIGADVNPDPPNFAPSWGNQSTLWLAVFGTDDGQQAVTVWPAGYGEGVNNRSNDAEGASVGSAQRNLAAAAENPGQFTIAGVLRWQANTVAIAPAFADANSVQIAGLSSGEHTITTYGIPDAELDFVPGTSDYVNLNVNNTPLDFTSEDFSIVVRVLTLDDLSVPRTLFACGDIDAVGGYQFFSYNNGKLTFQTNQVGVSQETRSAFGDFAVGGPYTVGATRSGASVKIFIDGVDKTDSAAAHIDPTTFGVRNPRIGTTYKSGVASNTYFYDGDIDEVAVFNKQLDDAEMLAIHNMYEAGGTLLVTDDVIGLWRLGENAGLTTYDATDNDIDGTLTGGPPGWVNKDDILAIADEDTDYIAEDYDTQAGVPDTGFDWVWNRNNVMPYTIYDKLSTAIGGWSLKLWYQPISMIIGTNLDDREGTDIGETGTAEEDGIITWGTNPAGIDISVGSLVSSSQPTISPAGEEEALDIVPEGSVPSGGTVDTVALQENPLYPIVQLINEHTGYTEEQIWFIGATLIILIAMGLAIARMPNHLLLAGIVGLVFAGFFTAMGIYQWWMMLIFGFMFIASLIMERKPVL